MSPIHAISIPQPELSSLAKDILAALRRLEKERQQHGCGGFTTDDMKWQMGKVFIDVTDAIDELEARKLIRFCGHDDNAAESACACYLLR